MLLQEQKLRSVAAPAEWVAVAGKMQWVVGRVNVVYGDMGNNFRLRAVEGCAQSNLLYSKILSGQQGGAARLGLSDTSKG